MIGLSTLGIAAVVAAICAPLASGRVRRNRHHGFRLVRSMESNELWIEIKGADPDGSLSSLRRDP